MEAPFKVGEILIFQNGTTELTMLRNNKECELIGGWEMRQIGEVDHVSKSIKTVEKECYQIKFPDGLVLNCQPHQLRRRKPPTKTREIDTVVSWGDCAWNPHKITEPA